ncbi:hypothetical protein [Ramlibacter sp.]|uniref:hypothetical protein n=1 Tax=Ramlibacter sp. TaxID=1917967 RepID=UPI003D111BFC
MPQQLTEAFVQSAIARAAAGGGGGSGGGFAPAIGPIQQVTVAPRAFSATEVNFFKQFVPPQSVDAWRAATDVEGHMSSRLFKTTKSRGDRLQRVDTAYASWIRDITNRREAENLRHALDEYRGFAFRITGSSVGTFGTNYRDARNRDNIMVDIAKYVDFIASLGGVADDMGEARAKEIRRDVLLLLGNIEVNAEPTGFIAGGLMTAFSITDAAGGVDAFMKLSTDIQGACGGSVGGAAAIGYAAYDIGNAAEKAQYGTGAWDRIKSAAHQFYDFLARIMKKFVDWAGAKLKAIFVQHDAGEIIGVLKLAAKAVFHFIMKACKEFVGGVGDALEGTAGLIEDAWLRRTLTLQAETLVTTQGEFALLRSGIRRGIELRQAVAAWTLAKGVTSIVLTATTAGASKIVDAILAGLEFLFKIVWTVLESSAIDKVLKEVKIVTTSMLNKATEIRYVPEVPDASTVSYSGMPPFKALNYTWTEVVNNANGAYMNLLDSVVKSSPVMSAILLNSGVVADVRDVMHAATPRSSAHETVANEHLRALKEQAVSIYTKSPFKIKPVPLGTLEAAVNARLTDLRKRAQLLAEPRAIAP